MHVHPEQVARGKGLSVAARGPGCPGQRQVRVLGVGEKQPKGRPCSFTHSFLHSFIPPVSCRASCEKRSLGGRQHGLGPPPPASSLAGVDARFPDAHGHSLSTDGPAGVTGGRSCCPGLPSPAGDRAGEGPATCAVSPGALVCPHAVTCVRARSRTRNILALTSGFVVLGRDPWGLCVWALTGHPCRPSRPRE